MAARREDIERAKGLAIVLVVFGHLVARAEPAGLTWYEPLRAAVYSFHMPLFFYLSGLAAALAGPPAAYWPYLRGRARRLLVPYAAFGLLILAGKLAAARIVAVDHVPASFGAGLAALFWRTGDSPAGSVWYLAVLFACAAALPPLLRYLGPGRALLLAGLLFLLPLPPLLWADRVGGYAVFFAAGVAAGRHDTAWTRWRDRVWPVCFLLLLVLLAGIVAGAVPAGRIDAGAAGRVTLLLAGLLAMPALHGAVAAGSVRRDRVLLALGRGSFAIYLLNTITIGLAKAALLTAGLAWTAADFPRLAVALMAAGLGGPLLLAAPWRYSRESWASARPAFGGPGTRNASVTSPSRVSSSPH
ncbi:acyltransferase [Acidisphaera rubrifaciens HS-AP3]|uniref:Acyltransferase n=1 Tax=Acidisphaera rubrifaciens HS-AP3 TaxID=1231350 RepID=A0A0D6P970_9PROT|nr:acyltransferase [Acidisphaera rubrifaciens HS-AP3]